MEKLIGNLIKDSKDRWERMEGNLEGIRKELEEMRKREER